MSRDWFQDISIMHDKFGFYNKHMDGEFLRFRQDFLSEELQEFDKAIVENNPEAAVDALIDICVVAIGTIEMAKIDGHKAWDEVLRANMSKMRDANPTRAGSGGFDLIKPHGWIPPNHSENTGKIGPAIEGIHVRRIGFKSDSDKLPSHVKTMDEWREFSLGKNHDYNDEQDPEFQHASYYPDGINNIVYEMWKKVKRIRRNLKRMMNGGPPPKTESVRDSFRDINIYSAIGGTYLDGDLEGQSPSRDIFNREKNGQS